MASRYRRVFGLLAILALTFSFGESVWASTCAVPVEGMEMAMEAGATEEGSRGIPCAGHGDDSEDRHEGAPCPFDSPGAVQTCVGVVSLPSRSAALPTVTIDHVPTTHTIDTRIALLLEASLFRPPRA